MMGGGGHSEPAPAPQAEQQYSQPQQNTQYQNTPCQFEMKQFMDCAQNQHDITLCQGFNEVLKDCRVRYGKMSLAVKDRIFLPITIEIFLLNIQTYILQNDYNYSMNGCAHKLLQESSLTSWQPCIFVATISFPQFCKCLPSVLFELFTALGREHHQ